MTRVTRWRREGRAFLSCLADTRREAEQQTSAKLHREKEVTAVYSRGFHSFQKRKGQVHKRQRVGLTKGKTNKATEAREGAPGRRET